MIEIILYIFMLWVWTLLTLQVCIVNDPRPENPYDQLYTVDYLGNMTRGRKVLYINKPIEYLKQLTLKTLTQEKAVSTEVYITCCLNTVKSSKTKKYSMHIFWILRAPDKVHIFISKMFISWPNPKCDHLLESSYRDDSNKWSNIGFM